MRANHKTGRQSDGKMSGIWEKIKERLGFGRKAEGDKEDDRVMYIIAGLGNPTREYEKTRHNVGFEVIDVLADRLGTTVEEKKFKGCYGRGIIGGQKVLLLKPQTFMNLSGESVRAAADFYKVDPEHIIIVYDDISLDVGQLRIRKKGSAGGHNGIKNIISHLGTQEFPRIKDGFPVVTNETENIFRVPKSLIVQEDVSKFNATSLEARDIKIKITNIDIPVAFASAFEGEIIRRKDMQVEFDGSRVDCAELVQT